jgi:ABC-type antimicrobial peptide transport system permease subunit
MLNEMVMQGLQNLPVSMGFVKEGFVDGVTLSGNQGSGETDAEIEAGNKAQLYNVRFISMDGGINYVSQYSDAIKEQELYFGNGETAKESLGANEIIVTASMLYGGNSFEDAKAAFTYNLEHGSAGWDKIEIGRWGGSPSVFTIVGIILHDGSDLFPTVIGNTATFNAIRAMDQQQSGAGGDMLQLSGFGFGPLAVNESTEWTGSQSEWNFSKLNLNTLSTLSNVHWADGAKTTLAANEVILNRQSFRWGNNSSTERSVSAQNGLFDRMDKTIRVGRTTWGWDNDLNLGYTEIIGGREVVVVGIADQTYVSDEIFDYLVELSVMPKGVMIALTDDWSTNREFFNYIEGTFASQGRIETKLKINTSVTGILDFFTSVFGMMGDIFLYVSIAFSAFAGLMLMNFIGISINAKRKEIGVLRAIGARSADVFKIFFNEGFLIGLINFILAGLMLVIASSIINGALGLSVMVPGILQFGLLAALVFGVVLVATFIPVRKIAKKKPIDAINNR